MQNEDLDTTSHVSLPTDVDQDSGQTFLHFIQMEELYDKLKLLNHENEFIKANKMRCLNR